MSGEIEFESIVAGVLAAAGLGTAAMSIVDGLKWTRLGAAGFKILRDTLGPALMSSMEHAYGPRYLELLEGQYRTGRGRGDLPRSLRQGIRVGVLVGGVESLDDELPRSEKNILPKVVESIRKQRSITAEERRALARFELTADARIDAGLALAEQRYRAATRACAGAISFSLALTIGAVIGLSSGNPILPVSVGALIGIFSVPIAPIAKDVVKAIRSAENVANVIRSADRIVRMRP